MGDILKELREIHSIGARTRERMIGVRGVPVLAGFDIRMLGISEARKGFAWTRLNPVHTQYLMTVEGTGEILLGNEWRGVGPGTAYLSPAGVPHAYRALPGKNWTICWVIYSGRPKALAEFLSEEAALLSIHSRQLRFAVEGACDAAAQHESPAQMELWARLVHQSVLHALKAEGHEKRLDFLWKTVIADLARPWSLDELASQAGMSKENLRRVCKRELNRSPMKHLARLRFQRAGELLSDAGNKVAFVAERVGYNDPFAFSSAFKREMGVSPSDYR